MIVAVGFDSVLIVSFLFFFPFVIFCCIHYAKSPATVLCGRWETYPREFAKCRRCRKAKYCGKECQSTAWSEGHRFWCSAKDVDEDITVERERERDRGEHLSPQQQQQQPHGGIQVAQFGAGDVVSVPVGRRERPTRERGDRVQGLVGSSGSVAPLSLPTRAEGSMARDRTLQQQQQLQASPHTRIRPRHGQGQPVPDPTNAAYLTFQVQDQESSGAGNVRRRAETITGLGGQRVDGQHAQQRLDGHRLVDVQIPPTAPGPHRMIPRHPLHHQPQGPLVPQEWFSPLNFRGRNEPGPSRRTNQNQNQNRDQTRRMDVSPTTTTTSLSYRGSSGSGMGGDDNDMVLG